VEYRPTSDAGLRSDVGLHDSTSGDEKQLRRLALRPKIRLPGLSTTFTEREHGFHARGRDAEPYLSRFLKIMRSNSEHALQSHPPALRSRCSRRLIDSRQ
jgi:hypothetical protein